MQQPTRFPKRRTQSPWHHGLVTVGFLAAIILVLVTTAKIIVRNHEKNRDFIETQARDSSEKSEAGSIMDMIRDALTMPVDGPIDENTVLLSNPDPEVRRQAAELLDGSGVTPAVQYKINQILNR